MTENLPGMRDEPARSREHRGSEEAIYTISEAHPEADRYPWMPDDELQELANDIAANGLRKPIRKLRDGRILDGRNRELACLIAGVEPAYIREDMAENKVRAFVRSENVFRRHLSREFRRELIADALRENPDQSNRAVAAELKVSHCTVADVRNELESTGQVVQLTATRGRDGKTRTSKPKKAKPKKANPKLVNGVKSTGQVVQLTTTATGDEPAGNVQVEQNPTVPPEPVNPFAELMSDVTALASGLTRAVNRGDESGRKLQAVMRDCGLMDYPPGKNPRVLPLAGVHALLELAGSPGPLPEKNNVALVYNRANGSWVPPLTKKRRERKGAGKAGAR